LSSFQQLNSKINPTRISKIKNGIGIPLPMGVPEIGTKNWNSNQDDDQALGLVILVHHEQTVVHQKQMGEL
jgi:hypothetical protein